MNRVSKERVLLVEDEASIREGVCDVLAYHGYEPSSAVNGPDGLSRALDEEFRLVMLDVMLPGMSGLDVCRKLRARDPGQSILMLTARGSEEDIVAGFRAGADDYVTKPFSVRELMARVEALLRRSDVTAAEPNTFEFGPWRVDVARLSAERGDDSCELTPREIALMELFATERGRVVSRRRLLSDVWKMSAPDDVETRTVDVHIAKLRKKIESESERLIETVRGAGYRFSG